MIAAYLTALGQILARKEAILADCRTRMDNADKVSEIRKTRGNAEEVLQEQIRQIHELVHENARRTQDQEEYRVKYDKKYKDIEKQKDLIARLKSEELELIAERAKLRRFIKALESCKDNAEFQAPTWNGIIEKAIVSADNRVTFILNNNEKVTINL